MSIKNNETKLLFNDFEGEENKKSSSELDFYVKYKDLGLDNKKQYYCYFYEKQNGKKGFIRNGNNHVILKNGYEAYNVRCSCKKNCVGLRFFVTDKEINNDEAKNMSPEKNKDVTWYEVKQDQDGKKYIAKYDSGKTELEETNISFAYSDDHFNNEKRWKIGPYKKYGDHKFLTHFNNYSQVYIKCDKFKQLISKDINGFEIDANNTDFNPNVYVCVKLHPGGDFYLDWSGNMKKGLEKDSGTTNNHNGYMEDMYILCFYVTNKKLDINEGDKFDENTLFDKNDKISVFEVWRDKSDNMVLWHLKNKEKGEWEVVDGEVRFFSSGGLKILVDKLSYNCKIQSENGIQKSYTVEILDIFDNSKKIGENTVEINNTEVGNAMPPAPIFTTEYSKLETNRSSQEKLMSYDNRQNMKKNLDDQTNQNIKNDLDNRTNQSKQQSNYHIGKTTSSVLLSILVGLCFGWLYALIPIVALILLIILDHKFNFCPGTKKILSYVMPCLSCLKKTEEKDKNLEPDLSKDMKSIEM